MHNFKLKFPFPESIQFLFRSRFSPDRVSAIISYVHLFCPSPSFSLFNRFSAAPRACGRNAPPALIRPPCARPKETPWRRDAPKRDSPLVTRSALIPRIERRRAVGPDLTRRLRAQKLGKFTDSNHAKLTSNTMPPYRLPGKCHMRAADHQLQKPISPSPETNPRRYAKHRELLKQERVASADKHRTCPSLFLLPPLPLNALDRTKTRPSVRKTVQQPRQ